MGLPTTELGTAARLEALTIEELFREAEQFGSVRVFGNANKRPPSCYRITIEFRTMRGMNLDAQSEFDMTLRAGLIQVIERAERVAAQFRSGQE